MKVNFNTNHSNVSANKSNQNPSFGKYVAEKGIAFVSVNYRMYPQAVYPQFIRDAAEAVGWVYKNIGKYGNCEDIYRWQIHMILQR